MSDSHPQSTSVMESKVHMCTINVKTRSVFPGLSFPIQLGLQQLAAVLSCAGNQMLMWSHSLLADNMCPQAASLGVNHRLYLYWGWIWKLEVWERVFGKQTIAIDT